MRSPSILAVASESFFFSFCTTALRGILHELLIGQLGIHSLEEFLQTLDLCLGLGYLLLHVGLAGQRDEHLYRTNEEGSACLPLAEVLDVGNLPDIANTADYAGHLLGERALDAQVQSLFRGQSLLLADVPQSRHGLGSKVKCGNEGLVVLSHPQDAQPGCARVPR